MGFTHAQTSTHSNEDMNRFLSHTLRYPAELREAMTTGPVMVSVQIDEAGYMTGDVEFLSGDKAFEDEINRTMNLLKENWSPSFLEGKAYGQEYLMGFEFRIDNGSRFSSDPVATASDKVKPSTPLEAVNNALEENPYSPKLLNKRAEILAQDGKKLLSDMDVNQANFLKDKMLTEVVIVGYLPAGPKSL